ncbi:MAG TPA: histidine--tRNA ligase [Candidatus Baltobacteraceae bacterium]|jgi:histidyl-tRNA synthetase|nr:histidine--tRNA ligase [Candidatus Baltobacteraceae bacterium]
MAQKLTAPRGTQDFLPPLTSRWRELEARMHMLAYRYGYGEIRTPIFESTELFERGVGEATDIVEKEMYTFTDKGDRSITLRPEITAPVMRAGLEHNLFAEGPQRLYYLGPIFRYERPQKGRYRQAHQFGIECTGFPGPEADVEVMSLAMHLFRSYGVPVELHVNSIGDENCRPKYRQALIEHFQRNKDALSEESQRRLERNPLRLLDSKSEADRPFLDSAPAFEEFLCDACREHFEQVKRYLDHLAIPYVVDPRIVRGLDYYTRTVFEFTSDALGAQSTVCAGGRYDDLIASLGGPAVPSVGFALGMERLLLMIEAAHPDQTQERSGIQVVALGDRAREVLVTLAALLRYSLAVPVFMDYADRKLLAQLKIADRNNARYALIVGSEEVQAGEAIVRDLTDRSDRRVPLGKDLVPTLVEVLA